MIFFLTTITVILNLSLSIPPQNMEKGVAPDVATARAGAVKLLEAIKTDDPSMAGNFFFPKDAFDLVKDMPRPVIYHRKLVKWYNEDINQEHKRFRSLPNAKVEKIEMGHCKWKAGGTEGNIVPYWSCTRSKVITKDGTTTRSFEITAMINWGKNWYVTHLGPIR